MRPSWLVLTQSTSSSAVAPLSNPPKLSPAALALAAASVLALGRNFCEPCPKGVLGTEVASLLSLASRSSESVLEEESSSDLPSERLLVGAVEQLSGLFGRGVRGLESFRLRRVTD